MPALNNRSGMLGIFWRCWAKIAQSLWRFRPNEKNKIMSYLLRNFIIFAIGGCGYIGGHSVHHFRLIFAGQNIMEFQGRNFFAQIQDDF